MNRTERIILTILACINFTHILDFMIMMPLGNYLMPHFSIGTSFFSLIVAAYPITACVSGIVAAFYVDRYDRKRILLFAYAGFLLGTLCCGIAPDEWFLVVARVVTGVFGGLIGAQVLSIIADIFPYEKRGRAMSSIFMAFAAASVFGVPFSLYLANKISWHAPFIFIALVGTVILPMINKFLPPVRSHIHATVQRLSIMQVLRQIFGDPAQRMALILAGTLMFGHFLLIPFLNPFLEFNKGFTKTQTPLVYMVGGVASMIASSFIGRLADHYGKFRVFLISVICSLIPIFIITNLPDYHMWVVLAIFGFWFAASTSRNIPVQAMISTVVQPEHRGRFMSFNSSFQQLFTGLASLVSGGIVYTSANGEIVNYNLVGYFSVLVVSSTIYLGYLLAKRQKLK
ncbi:MFS transporter [Pollutibacter soli]|uniref:MFS transporter n=1 Tax=Pollutibacter soli TaxID=3034157 RepID=UPI00301346F5